jgi:hypothetical protein
MRKNFKIHICLMSLMGLMMFSAAPVSADFSAIEIASSYRLADSRAKDGDIVSSSAKGLVRSTQANDSHMFGVVSTTPLVAYRSSGNSEVPVARNGIVNVNVTSLTGEILKGDLITTSEIPGKGAKAISSGYVLGVALDGFNGKSGTQVDFKGKKYFVNKIPVGMRIEYADINSPKTFKRMFDLLGQTFFSSASDPNKFGLIVRYIAAGHVSLVAILFAFLTFSRSIPKAVEAIGRNPLARNSIYFSLVVSVGVMLVVILLGIAGAFVLLKI